MGRLEATLGILCLVFLSQALSQSCSQIKGGIQEDANCEVLLRDVESGSVPFSDIPIIHTACATSQCRSNMDKYMYARSCGDVSDRTSRS